MNTVKMAEEHDGIPRLMWESEHEWLARVAFIDSNKEFYQGDRLGSLSMAWANWKFMGCSYGSEVQEILEECHSRVPAQVDEDINKLREQAVKTIKFVKSKSDELGTRIGLPNTGGKRPLANIEIFSISKQCKQRHLEEEKECQTSERENLSGTNNIELIPGLILYLPDDESDIMHISVLNESIQKCKKRIEYIEKFSNTANMNFTSDVMVDGKLIASACGINKKTAKRQAAENAVNILKTTQPVVHKKDINHDHVSTVEKKELVKAAYHNADKLPESNLGNQLLRKMGWTGEGGVGKREDGRADPVFVDAAEDRRGVGHQFADRSVNKSTVETTILSFLRDEEQAEMKFSSELSKEDRVLVHRLCQKYHLKHKSFGRDEQRYLLVSK